MVSVYCRDRLYKSHFGMYLTEDAFVLHIKKSTGSRCSYWPDVNAGPLVSLKKNVHLRSPLPHFETLCSLSSFGS